MLNSVDKRSRRRGTPYVAFGRHNQLADLSSIGAGNGTPELVLVRQAATRIKTWGDYTVLRVAQPGRRLDDAAKQELMAMMARAASVMVGGVDISAHWQERSDYHDRLTEWVIAEHAGSLVGWCGVSSLDARLGPVIYVDTLGVMPGHRRAGIGTCLVFEAAWRFWRGRATLPAITLRTQSPAVYAMLRRFVADSTYPGLTMRPVSASHRALEAVKLTAHHINPSTEADAQTGIVRGGVGFGSLYGHELPWSGDPEVDDFFRRELDVSAGDALIAAVVVNAWTVARAVAVYLRLRSRLALRSG